MPRDIGVTRRDASRRRWLSSPSFQVRRWRRLVTVTVVTTVDVLIVPAPELPFVLPEHCVFTVYRELYTTCLRASYCLRIAIPSLASRLLGLSLHRYSLHQSSTTHRRPRLPTSRIGLPVTGRRDRHRMRPSSSTSFVLSRALLESVSAHGNSEVISLCNCNQVCVTHLRSARVRTYARYYTYTHISAIEDSRIAAGERERGKEDGARSELNLPSCKHGQVRKCGS